MASGAAELVRTGPVGGPALPPRAGEAGTDPAGVALAALAGAPALAGLSRRALRRLPFLAFAAASAAAGVGGCGGGSAPVDRAAFIAAVGEAASAAAADREAEE